MPSPQSSQRHTGLQRGGPWRAHAHGPGLSKAKCQKAPSPGKVGKWACSANSPTAAAMCGVLYGVHPSWPVTSKITTSCHSVSWASFAKNTVWFHCRSASTPEIKDQGVTGCELRFSFLKASFCFLVVDLCTHVCFEVIQLWECT